MSHIVDSAEYKKLCSRPDSFQRSELNETEKALARTPPLVAMIQEVLSRPPIPKPAEYSGSQVDDFFRVNLSEEATVQIIDELFDCEAGAVGQDGETTTIASKFAGLVDKWQRYLEFVH